MASVTAKKVEKVRFYNGRMNGIRSVPSIYSEYVDENGVSQRFRDIPLKKADGKWDEYTTRDGEVVRRTYGQPLKFNNRRHVDLHPIVHEEVIKAIRSMPITRSSQAPHGLIEKGQIIEHEPEIVEQKEYNQAKLKRSAYVLVDTLEKHQEEPVFMYVCALLNIRIKDSDASKVNRLNAIAEDNPQKLLELFDDAENCKLDARLINPAIIKIAIQQRKIKNEGGVYWFNDVQLGSNADKIHVEYTDLLGEIKAAVDGLAEEAPKKTTRSRSRQKS